MLQPEDNQAFDDQMRERLENVEFSPPPSIWDKIDEELPPSLPLFLKFRQPTIAAIWAFVLMSIFFIYQKFDYAYKVNQFMTETLIESDQLEHSGDLNIFGLNLTTVANFGKHQEIQRKKLLAQQGQQLEKTETSLQNFTGAQMTVNSNKDDKKNKYQQPNSPLNTSKSLQLTKVPPIKFNGRKIKNTIAKTPLDKISFSEIGLSPQNSFAENTSEIIHGAIRTMTSEELLTLDPVIVCELKDDEQSPYQYDAQKEKVKRKTNLQRNKGFFFGPEMGSHFTAMTLSSKEGVNTSMMDQTPTFGTFYGISTGYILNNRWTFGIEWIYNSSEGQRFEGEFKGKHTRKYVDLDYFKIPIYAKYRHHFFQNNKKIKTSFNSIAGFHYSKLKNTNTFINGEIEAFDISHNRHQWGMLIGAELDIYATERIFLSLGVRGTFNADIGNLPTLRGLNNTDAFSVQTGAYAKLHYVLGKKGVK